MLQSAASDAFSSESPCPETPLYQRLCEWRLPEELDFTRPRFRPLPRPDLAQTLSGRWDLVPTARLEERLAELDWSSLDKLSAALA